MHAGTGAEGGATRTATKVLHSPPVLTTLETALSALLYLPYNTYRLEILSSASPGLSGWGYSDFHAVVNCAKNSSGIHYAR
jgi:hypothetical protein